MRNDNVSWEGEVGDLKRGNGELKVAKESEMGVKGKPPSYTPHPSPYTLTML
jgi:hypothetical protein